MASPRSKRIVVVLVLLGLVGGLVAWQWYPIRVKMILMGSGGVEEKEKALRALGTPGIPALIGAFESEGGEWDDKTLVGRLLVREPYRRVLVLERSLESESKTVRRVSAAILVATGNLDERDRILTAMLDWKDDPEWGHRVDLGDAARGFGGDEGIEILSAILADRDRARRARANAANYLGVFFQGDPAVIPPLVACAREDSSEVVRARALQSLGALGWAEDMSLFESILTSEDSNARIMVADGLGKIRNAKSEELLVGLLADPVESVRWFALNGLQAQQSRRLLDLAPVLREDAYPSMRSNLSRALGELGDKAALPYVVRGLEDEKPDEGHNALLKTIRALHKLTGKHHGFPAEPFQKSQWGFETREQVALAWTGLSDAERQKHLKTWYEECGTYDRRPALLKLLRHADPNNVARAVRELHVLAPDAPTPGFDSATVKAAVGTRQREDAAFVALAKEATAFQALAKEKRDAHLAAWDEAHSK